MFFSLHCITYKWKTPLLREKPDNAVCRPRDVCFVVSLRKHTGKTVNEITLGRTMLVSLHDQLTRRVCVGSTSITSVTRAEEVPEDDLECTNGTT